MENFKIPPTLTSGIGALAVNSPSGLVIRRIYVIQRKRRIVPPVAGESDDGMAPFIHHSPSKY
eukprot:2553168-Pleurochrysis_carterae.AAC.1